MNSINKDDIKIVPESFVQKNCFKASETPVKSISIETNHLNRSENIYSCSPVVISNELNPITDLTLHRDLNSKSILAHRLPLVINNNSNENKDKEQVYAVYDEGEIYQTISELQSGDDESLNSCKLVRTSSRKSNDKQDDKDDEAASIYSTPKNTNIL
jgi:hypothetical protein